MFFGRFSSLDVDDEEVDHVDIAKRATQMVEKLSDENQALRTEVEQAQKQLATVGRVRVHFCIKYYRILPNQFF